MKVETFKCDDCKEKYEEEGNNFILNNRIYDLCPECKEKWEKMIEGLGDGRETVWVTCSCFPVPTFTPTPFQITPIPYDEHTVWYDNGTGNACPTDTKIESKTG